MEDPLSPESAIREPEEIRLGCSRKLRRIEAGPYFKAILACLLEERWGDPHILELRLTADHGMLARLEGELCFKRFTGKESDLIRSIHRTGKAAHLDGDELGYLLAALAKIKKPRPNR